MRNAKYVHKQTDTCTRTVRARYAVLRFEKKRVETKAIIFTIEEKPTRSRMESKRKYMIIFKISIVIRPSAIATTVYDSPRRGR